jgi:hypothetical protein
MSRLLAQQDRYLAIDGNRAGNGRGFEPSIDRWTEADLHLTAGGGEHRPESLDSIHAAKDDQESVDPNSARRYLKLEMKLPSGGGPAVL